MMRRLSMCGLLVRRLLMRLSPVLMLCLALSTPAFAVTDVINVYFLSMQEAADAARSQLSDSGKVAAIASQKLLIIDDDSSHIQQAKALLKRIDRAPGQYTAFISIEDVSANTLHTLQANTAFVAGQTALSGGWLQVKLQHQTSQAQHRQSFQLRISSHQQGSIETGSLQSFNHSTRLWLAGYGVISAQSVELIPITSGFRITVSPVGAKQLRVRIVPWMQRSQANVRNQTSLQGQTELLLGLGNTIRPNVAPNNPANLRYNALPVLQKQAVIALTGAATELIVPIDQSITIAATSKEAKQLGQALLSRFSIIGKRQIVMHLRISKN